MRNIQHIGHDAAQLIFVIHQGKRRKVGVDQQADATMLLQPALLLGAKGEGGIEKRQIAAVEPVLHDPHRGIAVDGMNETIEDLV